MYPFIYYAEYEFAKILHTLLVKKEISKLVRFWKKNIIKYVQGRKIGNPIFFKSLRARNPISKIG